MTAAPASETSSHLLLALFSFSALMQYQQQRSPRLALTPSFLSSSLVRVPSKTHASSLLPSLDNPEAAWRLLTSSVKLIANKYNLLQKVRQASREWCDLRTTKALHRASIAQKIKEIFEEETFPASTTKELARKFRRDWKGCLEK